MGRKPRRKFTDEQKQKAVAEFLAGTKSTEQIAIESGVEVGVIYKWKAQLDAVAKGQRVEELESQGMPSQMARKVLQMEAEIEEYQKKVAEQSIIIDLLKKLQTSPPLVRESELTGLIETSRRLARAKKPAK
jgi:transposase-like protein